MKAAVLTGFKEPPQVMDRRTPIPGQGEILIPIRGTKVTDRTVGQRVDSTLSENRMR